MKNKLLILCILAVSFLATDCLSKRNLRVFKVENLKCYNRLKEPYTSVVDSHIHFRPFGGPAIPFSELNSYLNKLGVLFVNIYGIGQTLPIDSVCDYYLDCPGVPVTPSIKNDFINAAHFLEQKPSGVHMTLSMTFADLAAPQNIIEQIRLLEKEYPGMFKWMGEVNLVKQALFNNGHKLISKASIKEWSAFMKYLEQRDIPITIHSDLGNDVEPEKYLYLMKEVLRLYPKNKIIWAHMGLSKELMNMDPSHHIRLMKLLLDNNKNLMLDIAWRVLHDAYFKKEEVRNLYVSFFNAYSTRILTGTDFVAARKKDFATYKEELEITSQINKYLNDEAFRNIVLGENYFRILGLNYKSPPVCNELSDR
ncbi:MAG: amidohydrolase family protein [Deltaproteobacteria bacterium]|nr:amidohydrolase family protein [Deltaproteobacteria bacterium]